MLSNDSENEVKVEETRSLHPCRIVVDGYIILSYYRATGGSTNLEVEHQISGEKFLLRDLDNDDILDEVIMDLSTDEEESLVGSNIPERLNTVFNVTQNHILENILVTTLPTNDELIMSKTLLFIPKQDIYLN